MAFMLMRVREAFPVLYKAEEFKPGDGKPRYSVALLVDIDSDNDKAINEAIDKAIKDAFPDEAKAAAFRRSCEGQGNKWCYVSGDMKDYEGYAGKMILSCHRREKDGRPKLFGLNPKLGEVPESEGLFYGGCYVNAKVEIYVQTTENPGVRASFSGLQFCGHGDAFSGGAVATADDFEDLSSEAADAAASML